MERDRHSIYFTIVKLPLQEYDLLSKKIYNKLMSYATELNSHPKNRVYQGKLTYALNIEFEFTLNSM